MISPRIVPLTLAIFLAAPMGLVFAQTASSPIEINDCTVIEGVQETTHFVLTTDLACPAASATSQHPGPGVFLSPGLPPSSPVRGAAIDIRNNPGRVLIDLNGRTITGGAGRDSTGIRISQSPRATIRGNRHTRTDSGTWGATVQDFEAGIEVLDSPDVSISHSGVANGGMYIYSNDVGIHALHSDRVYINSLSVAYSPDVAIAIDDCDSPYVRLVNVDSDGGTGLALYDSPHARISGSSGRIQDNGYGLALHEGSDFADVTSWRANRAVGMSPGYRFHWYENVAQNDGESMRPAAGIFVGADNVTLDNLRFNKTGTPNTCDIYTAAGLATPPSIGAATVLQRTDGSPLLCENQSPELMAFECQAFAAPPSASHVTCSIGAIDPDGDLLTYEWYVSVYSPQGATPLGPIDAPHVDFVVPTDPTNPQGQIILDFEGTVTDPDGASIEIPSTTLGL